MDTSRRCIWLLAAWALVQTSPAAWATSYPESLNLAKLTDRAERIFVGEVLARTTGTDPAGLLATVYTFRVDQAVKGDLPAAVTIKQIGVPHPVEDRATGVLTFPVSGMPVYEPGQRYLLFLNGTSDIGFTSPVGLAYGAFAELPTGGAVNHLNNAGLFRGMPAPPLSASAARAVNGHRRGPVDLPVLVDATAALAGTVPVSPSAGLPPPPPASAHPMLRIDAASPPGNVGALVGGHPFRWNIPTAANPLGILEAVPYDVEAGPLGNASNASAVAKVVESFAKWAAPATTALTVTGSPGRLGVDVNAACPSPTCYLNWHFVMDGKSPIIFDADGSITNALSGSPCGFAGVGGFQGQTTDGGLTFTIESTVVLDGAWLGGVCGNLTLDEFGATITHELGHFLTIDHTIVNGELVIAGEPLPGAGVPPCASVEVMLSNAVPGCRRPNVLQKDDVSIVSLLYPSAGFATGTGRITGHLFAPDGVTPVNCGNMIVRNAADPFFDAVASITGIGKELGTAPPTQAGAYQVPGLTLGASYVVEVTQLPGFAAGGSHVTDLCDPVPTLPGPDEFYNGSRESADPGTDNPSCSVPVVAATSTPGIDIVLNGGASSAAPCETGQATLTVSRAGGGTGIVTSTPPGIGCGADCREDYDVASVVELAAAAGAGSRFTGWNGGGCNGTGGCTVTLTASTTVTATFQPQTVTSATLTVSRAGIGGGTVSSVPAGIACGTDCSQTYAIGTVVTLTATPAADSRFTGWSGGGCSGTGACVLTMSAVMTVSATFEPLPSFRVTVAVDRPAAGPGETTVGSLTISNPGVAAVADFYLGLVLPDGETLVLFTDGGGHAFARASDLGTLPRVATAVSLARPFTVTLPSVFAHTWTGAEAPGTYLFFLAAVSTGRLADGSVDDGELLAVTQRSFVFTP